jgi:hypothetical protein
MKTAGKAILYQEAAVVERKQTPGCLLAFDKLLAGGKPSSRL